MKEVTGRLSEMLQEAGVSSEQLETLKEETDLIQDLGMDSISLFALAKEIEEEWGLDIFMAEEFDELFHQFGRLASYIDRNRT